MQIVTKQKFNDFLKSWQGEKLSQKVLLDQQANQLGIIHYLSTGESFFQCRAIAVESTEFERVEYMIDRDYLVTRTQVVPMYTYPLMYAIPPDFYSQEDTTLPVDDTIKSVEHLELEKQQALIDEDYEEAKRLQDLIDKKKK